MALKITTQIGTDKGLTSEAYIRISKYLIDKSGYGKFDLQIFQKQEDASSPLVSDLNVPLPSVEAKSKQIGEFMHISLVRPVTTTVRKTVPVQVEQTIRVPVLDSNNQPTGELEDKVVTRTVPQEQDVDVTTEVPDMSSAIGIDIFSFAYAKLKEELGEVFGIENIVDC